MSSGQNYMLNLIPYTKLGLSPIGCEDFSMTASIKNGVSVQGRPLAVMKVLCNLGKGKASQRLN